MLITRIIFSFAFLGLTVMGLPAFAKGGHGGHGGSGHQNSNAAHSGHPLHGKARDAGRHRHATLVHRGAPLPKLIAPPMPRGLPHPPGLRHPPAFPAPAGLPRPPGLPRL